MVTAERLQHNLARVEERILSACARAGRKRDEVTLVAVTKYVAADVARILFELGVQNLGESRPQEFKRKAAAIPQATWHLVGHLQRNKIDLVVPTAALIHSVDSIRLLQALDQAGKQKPDWSFVNVLLEFNCSGDSAKHGFQAEELDAVVETLRGCNHVVVLGLMTMAPFEGTLDDARRAFVRLRTLGDKLRPRLPDAHSMLVLSMGMTNDFEVAIEEGATLVRIGSALFEGLDASS